MGNLYLWFYPEKSQGSLNGMLLVENGPIIKNNDDND